MGTFTDRSISAEPLPTLNDRLPALRSIKPELPEPAPLVMMAVTLASALKLTSPVKSIFAGVELCGMRLILSNVSVPPESVKVRPVSTCNVCRLRLPAPPKVTGPENWAPFVVESHEGT